MIYKSIYGDLPDVPNGNAVTGFFESPYLKGAENDHKLLYVDSVTGNSISVGQYKRLVPRAAAIFQTEYGVTRGDVVGLFGINHIFTPVIHKGVLSLAATLSPANIMYSSEELAYQLKATNPKILIVFDPVHKTAVDAVKEAATATDIVTFSQLFEQFAEALANPNAAEVAPVEVDGRKTHAYYCFSSGTSGLPKGVITTHYNIIANVLQQVALNSPYLSEEYPQSCVLPMSHIFALNSGIWLGGYACKRTLVFPKFDLEDFVSKVVKYKIKLLVLVPPIILALAKLPILDKYPEFGETVKLILSGAAPLSKDTAALLVQRCPKIKVAQGYGLTETTPVTHLGATRDHHKYDGATVGWLVPGAEAKLVDPDTGKDIEVSGQRGELWVRGPMIMAGYLNNKAATDDVITPEGWFKTGDVAVVNETNQFQIVDRIKELIKSNGHQVAPAELEAILLTHPDVIDVAVIGVYNDAKTTEMPRAYLVLKDRTKAKDIVKWFNKRVAKHKRLWGGAVLVEQIPKSASGKILRRDLRDRAPNDKDVVVGSELASL